MATSTTLVSLAWNLIFLAPHLILSPIPKMLRCGAKKVSATPILKSHVFPGNVGFYQFTGKHGFPGNIQGESASSTSYQRTQVPWREPADSIGCWVTRHRLILGSGWQMLFPLGNSWEPAGSTRNRRTQLPWEPVRTGQFRRAFVDPASSGLWLATYYKWLDLSYLFLTICKFWSLY